MSDSKSIDFSFRRKDELKPADIDNVNIMRVEDKMSNAVVLALVQLSYEKKLMNDDTYRNVLKKVKR